MEMQEAPQGTGFEHLPMARASVPDVLMGQYRVYSSRSDFSTVTADSALQALEMSGLGRAYKIERHSMLAANVIAPSFWSDEKPVLTSSAEAAPQPAIAPAETIEIAVEAPLSNNDIDKLLNG